MKHSSFDYFMLQSIILDMLVRNDAIYYFFRFMFPQEPTPNEIIVIGIRDLVRFVCGQQTINDFCPHLLKNAEVSLLRTLHRRDRNNEASAFGIDINSYKYTCSRTTHPS